jgi:hypothetical protein
VVEDELGGVGEGFFEGVSDKIKLGKKRQAAAEHWHSS